VNRREAAPQRRRLLAALGALVLVAAAVAGYLVLRPTDAPPAAGPAAIQTAQIDQLAVPEPEPAKVPEPEFTRTMFAATDIDGYSAVLDACRGPIAVDLGSENPVLVSEHDYCGGAAWMPKLELDDTVELRGDGVDEGVYVVSAIDHAPRRQTRVSDLSPEAEIVLQTCVSPTQMVLVSLEKTDPDALVS
jgi:hypothetical protein